LEGWKKLLKGNKTSGQNGLEKEVGGVGGSLLL